MLRLQILRVPSMSLAPVALSKHGEVGHGKGSAGSGPPAPGHGLRLAVAEALRLLCASYLEECRGGFSRV